jgi:hypothetical protein
LKHTGEPRELENVGSRVTSMRIDDTGNILVYAGQGGDVHVLDLSQKHRVLAKFKASPGW